MTAANPYLVTQVLTATPARLVVMLLDGAVRFTRRGISALERRDLDAAHHALVRAQEIVAELMASLDPAVDAELTRRLAAIYTFIHRRLVDANTRHDVLPAEEAFRLLQFQRESMAMLERAVESGSAADAN